jgi:vacuolar-type H+-ATPase subunit E/Vma4
MSLADIVRKIEQDAAAEAAQIVKAAEQDAAQTRADTAREIDVRHDKALSQARTACEEDARMKIAAARLAGRDRLLVEKRVLITRVLEQAAEKLVTQPDEGYAALLAGEVASASRGTEKVLLGRADADRLQEHLPAALEAAGCDTQIGGVTDDIERGVLLEGDRMRVEVSVAAMVAARREQCETSISQALFGEEA